MKISISNLGVIPDLQISLKPLTVFVGENGTGKTWTAYAIAAIFGLYGFNKYLEAYLHGKGASRCPSVDKAIDDLIEKGSATFNIVEFSIEYAESYINEIAKLAPTWMNSFMATRRIDFGKMSIRAELSEADKHGISGHLKHSKINKTKSVGMRKDSSELELNCLKEEDSDQLYFYTTYAKNGSGEIPRLVVGAEKQILIVNTIFRALGEALFTDVKFFPTERATYITLRLPYEKPEYTKSAKLDSETESGTSWLPMLFEPVTDLLGTIAIGTWQYTARTEEEARDPKIIDLIKLGKFLEDEILLGNISAERHGNEIELIHHPAENVGLEINVSSSMVKVLTPLSLYLKYAAKPGDMIVIDEPEMNLHPAAQVELTEFLGMLVNAGLHVLITTHSPYIVDHIPNLIRANDLDKEKVKKYFYLEQATSFLSKDDVSVYLFDNDSVTDILKEDGDINWGTFSEVSRDLSRIYTNLIE